MVQTHLTACPLTSSNTVATVTQSVPSRIGSLLSQDQDARMIVPSRDVRCTVSVLMFGTISQISTLVDIITQVALSMTPLYTCFVVLLSLVGNTVILLSSTISRIEHHSGKSSRSQPTSSQRDKELESLKSTMTRS